MIGEIVRAGISAYAGEGFPDEWKYLHQGGPTGYAGRDFMATPDEKRAVLDKQAVAWNPSITGSKVEETCIASSDGIEIITTTPGWPAIAIFADGQKKMSRSVGWNGSKPTRYQSMT